MCQNNMSNCELFSVSQHYKIPTEHVGLVLSNCPLHQNETCSFHYMYSWQIASLALWTITPLHHASKSHLLLFVFILQLIFYLIWVLVFNATFSNISAISIIMATSFSGGRSRSTRWEPSTICKQLVNFITCGCESSGPIFIIYKAGCEPTPYWW